MAASDFSKFINLFLQVFTKANLEISDFNTVLMDISTQQCIHHILTIFFLPFLPSSFQLIRPNSNVYATRSSQSNKISSFKTRYNFFKDSFFPAVISEWNSLDINIRNSSSIN